MVRWFLTLSLCVAVAGCQQSQDASTTETDQTTPESLDEVSNEADVLPNETQEVAFVEGDQATLEVPKMMCPFACYPRVKETLEGLEGIQAVELVPQKEENVIDDRRVTITFAGRISPQEVTSALEKAEFPGATFE